MRLGRGWPVFTSVPYNGDVRQQVIHHTVYVGVNSFIHPLNVEIQYVERLNLDD